MVQPKCYDKNSDPIPSDINLAILQFLGSRDLATCSRVSTSFHLIVTPLLYKVVRIDFRKDINPLFSKSREVKNEPVKAGRAKRGASGKYEKEGQEGGLVDTVMGVLGMKKEKKRMNNSNITYKPPGPTTGITCHSTTNTLKSPNGLTQDSLPNRFSYTTHLTLSSHTHEICDSLNPLFMPKLISLRITSDFLENHLNLCHCVHSNKHPQKLCTATPPCVCPVITHLRPKTLHIGSGGSAMSGSTGLSGSGLGLWKEGKIFPPEWVKEIVVCVGSCSGIEIGKEKDSMWIDKLPSSLERLTLVFDPQSSWGGDGRWRFRRVAGMEGSPDSKWLWDKMGLALSGDAKVLEVVGVECIDRDWTEMSIREEIARIRRSMRKVLERKGWEGKRVNERVEGVRFLERREFDLRMKKSGC